MFVLTVVFGLFVYISSSGKTRVISSLAVSSSQSSALLLFQWAKSSFR